MENASTGEKIAGAAGVALILIMFIFDCFTVEAAGGIGPSFGGNAWDVFDVIDWVLLITSIAAIALAVIAVTNSAVNLPVALSAIVTGLGILSVILILFRIISPPDGGLGDLIDVGRSIGVFLGLIAAAGVAYGGWRAMSEEGTSFGAQADRLGNDRTPPPPASPPPAGPAA